MEMKNIKIVGVMDEDPFHYQTWSGSSRYFFNALQGENILLNAISASPSKVHYRIAQILAYSLKRNTWKMKYHLSRYLFNQMTKTAERQMSPYASNFNVILQVGAWYNFTNVAQFQNKLFCSYHDGNLAMQLARPDSVVDKEQHHIVQALEYEQNLYNKLDVIFTMSEWLRRSFITDFHCDPSKVKAVGAGINLDTTGYVSQKEYSSPNVLFVGIDFERKGGLLLLEAFKYVRAEIKNAKLTIIGPELKNLPSYVTCLGRISKKTKEGLAKLQDEYSKASVFVLPSLYEPFGVAFVEAMAHKLPCIGTATCAMPEIISHGVSGYIVPVNDSRALADNMITLLKNSGMAKKFGEEGCKKYIEKYNWECVAKAIKNALEELSTKNA